MYGPFILSVRIIRMYSVHITVFSIPLVASKLETTGVTPQRKRFRVNNNELIYMGLFSYSSK